MSVGPRIVFTRFISSSAPKLHPWREHFRRVVGGQPSIVSSTIGTVASVSDSVVVWHLVSANNRMLARSAKIYRSFDDAVAGARTATTAVMAGEVRMVVDRNQGLHGWYVSTAGEALFTCARWYDTERERRKSIDLAVNSFSIAVIASGARLMNPALMRGADEPLEH